MQHISIWEAVYL